MNRSRHSRQTPEGAYIPQARRVLTASILREKAREDELAAKRACASAMHASHMKEFTFDYEDDRYLARLKRKRVKVINPRKVYTLLSSGQITLDEFFDCIEAPIEAVLETLGDKGKALVEDEQKGIDLYIQKLKKRH